MTLRTPVLLFTLGATFGAVVVVACGDDSPNDVDAADADDLTCDCAPAEPPLAGRIVIQEITAPVTLPAGGFGVQGLQCVGGTLLTGSCRLNTLGPEPEVTLSEAGLDDRTPGVIAWQCVWNNPTPREIMGEVRVLCLMPAEQ